MNKRDVWNIGDGSVHQVFVKNGLTGAPYPITASAVVKALIKNSTNTATILSEVTIADDADRASSIINVQFDAADEAAVTDFGNAILELQIQESGARPVTGEYKVWLNKVWVSNT